MSLNLSARATERGQTEVLTACNTKEDMQRIAILVFLSVLYYLRGIIIIYIIKS